MAAQTTVYASDFVTNSSQAFAAPVVEVARVPPTVEALAGQMPLALGPLLIPTALLYASILSLVAGRHVLFKLLTFSSILSFFACAYLPPISCGPISSLQYFLGTQVSYPMDVSRVDGIEQSPSVS